MEITNRNYLSRSVFAIGLAVVLSGVGASLVADDAGDSAAKLTQAEEADAKKVYEELDKRLELARLHVSKKEFAEADKIFQSVLAEQKKIPGTLAVRRNEELTREITSMRRDWADSIIARGKMAIAEGRYQDAINIVSEAQVVDPASASKVSSLVEYCRQKLTSTQVRQDISLASADKDLTQNDKNVELLMNEAKTFFVNKRYEEARNRLERIYIIDPYNAQATYMLNQLYQKMYDAGAKRANADIDGIYAASQWVWQEPVFPSGLDNAVVKPAEIKDAGTQNLYAKLEQIVIPSFKLEDSDILSAIRLLNRLSKNFDPEGQGVSINSGFNDETAQHIGRINVSAIAPMSLLEVIKFICEDTGLAYRIDSSSNSIIIGPGVDQKMDTQFFQVRGDLISSIAGTDGADGTGAATGGATGNANAKIDATKLGKAGEGTDVKEFLTSKEGTATTTQRPSVTAVALMKYFDERGVTFGEGSSISYDKRAGKLVVKNTAENLRRMDELLRQLDAIKTPLVMVEVKAIEVAETDMQELGFNWTMGELTSTSSNEHMWMFEQGPDSLPVTRSNDWGVDAGIIKNLNVFPMLFGEQKVFGSDQGFNLTLTIDALSRNLRTETLSAPKAMATSGSTASVRMVKSYYFPESWDTYEIEINSGSASITAPTPTFSDEFDVGIIFDVTPVVNPDNYTINMDINPTVTSYLGPDNYPIVIEGIMHSGIFIPTYDAQGNLISAKEITTPTKNEFNVWMPIISRRNLKVNVTVYDGETILIGGMIDSVVQSRTDKWPVLGYLPLVGRLFQSQQENTERRNLLLFVTTRLVNNDGVPVRRNLQRGAPDFNR